MAEKSGFFDAHVVDGGYDRVYLAENFAKYFASFIGNGVFGGKSMELVVQENKTISMGVRVLSGQAWINGYWYENTDECYLPIDVADGTLHRIDSIVVRWDKYQRNIYLAVLKGTANTNPIAPTLRRENDLYELKLADIYVSAGTTVITQEQITDTRMNAEACGFVTGVVKQLDITDLSIWINEFKVKNISEINTLIAEFNEIIAKNDLGGLITKMIAFENKVIELQASASSPYNFKGSILYSELPTSGNKMNDTYYCTDVKKRYTWNGNEWHQNGLSEGQYLDELSRKAPKNEFDSLKKTFDDTLQRYNLANPENFTRERYMNVDGVTGSTTSPLYFYTEPIDVNAGDTIYMTNARFVTAFYDGAVVPNSGIDNSAAGSISAELPYFYTVPSGVNQIVITGFSTTINKFMVCVGEEIFTYKPYSELRLSDSVYIKQCEENSENIARNTEDIALFLSSGSSINLANIDFFVKGSYLRVDGVAVADADGAYFYTNEIKVKTGDVISCTPSRFLTAYKNGIVSAKDGVSAVVDGVATKIEKYIVPEGITSIRLTGYTYDINSYMVNYGETLKIYRPYEFNIHKLNAVSDKVKSLSTSLDVLSETTNFVADAEDKNILLGLPAQKSGFVALNGKTTVINSTENNAYKHYTLTLEPGRYILSGAYYKLIRFFYVTDSNDNVISMYPDAVDANDSAVYPVTNMPISIEEGQILHINKYSLNTVSISKVERKAQFSSQIMKSAIGNILYGKKWAVCGDSFSAGDFGDALTSDNIITDGKHAGKNKVYGYIIGNRNNMTIQNLSAGGRTMATPVVGSQINAFSASLYKHIEADVDYITLYFGINDSHNEDKIPFGTIDDITINTFYGAWNVVLEYLITNYPFAHIGIIVSNGCDDDKYRIAEIELANKWGIPYIDLNGDQHTPMMIRSTNNAISSVARDARTRAQAVNYGKNNHPSSAAHEYESNFIEDFLRRL